MISVDQFFDILLEELKQNNNVFKDYYKFLGKQSSFEFRKAYFCQRLQYIADNIGDNKDQIIFDLGCGYATTAIFLVLNGYKVHGITLEFYFKYLPERIKFYSKYGDLSGLTVGYENLYDKALAPNSIDAIIVQDTMHHLEPMQVALSIINKSLKIGGKVLVVEVNGDNILENLKYLKQRGTKRIIKYYDEQLKKELLMGNENIRGIEVWKTEFINANFSIAENSIQYFRYYMPFMYKNNNTKTLIEKEREIWKRNSFLRKYFFLGVNFLVFKK